MKKVYITDFIAEPLEPERGILADVAEMIAFEADLASRMPVDILK